MPTACPQAGRLAQPPLHLGAIAVRLFLVFGMREDCGLIRKDSSHHLPVRSPDSSGRFESDDDSTPEVALPEIDGLVLRVDFANGGEHGR